MVATDMMQETSGPSMDSTTLGVFRTAATVKGGRRFSFGALVVVGDHNGRVGYGHGKAKEVPQAIEKAEKDAKRSLLTVPRLGTTIGHEVTGRYASSIVRLIPASPGTGVIAGSVVRAVLEAAGVRDCMTKCYGSTNPRNVVKAVFDALEQLRTRDAVARARGVEITSTDIEERINRSRRTTSGADDAPVVSTVGGQTEETTES